MPTPNRLPSGSTVFLSGLVLGTVSYVISEFLIPGNFSSPGDHDIFLATRLGFVYAPLVGAWIGWLQRSWLRIVAGVIVGIGVGVIYMFLCPSRNFLAIMVGFPTLLGGLLAVVLASNRSPWLKEVGARLGKGLLAGFVLGLVYMVVLNLTGAMFMGPNEFAADFKQTYVHMMWRSGPIALCLSSGLFLVLLRWAVGLSRVKMVFEAVDTNTAG